MKNICVVTATRSEYGLLRWIIDILSKDKDVNLQIVATGSHLSKEFGMTYHFIEHDGYTIDAKIDMELHTEDLYSIPRSMGICAEKISYAFRSLKPDMIVILGDRYELLPIVNTALLFNIPIAHISGGDITEGAIDNEVRNAVTMMSSLHFPGTEESAVRLRRMLGMDENIYVVGEPGLDSFLRHQLMTRSELAEQLNLNASKQWMLVTLHSETKESLDYNLQMTENLYNVMIGQKNVQFVVTKANADFGGSQINKYWDAKQDDDVRVVASLGQLRYLSFMSQVECVLGNSSSGIVEAPFLGIPVVNIGNRQKGRHICKNVICCGISQQEIEKAISYIVDYRLIDKFWGDGHASEQIVQHIKDYLPQEYQQADVKVYEVNKRNGIIQDGLVVRQKGVAVSPMLYLDAYDYSYPETALKKTARDYVDIVANGQNLIEMLVEKMKGEENILNRVTLRAINRERNTVFLADKPYMKLRILHSIR